MALRGVLLMFLVLLAGCATVATEELPTVGEAEYRIGPGDTLNIAVFREEALSGEFVVGEQGMVSLPLVGDVEAVGKTIPQFRDDLVALLGGEFVRNPQVAVSPVSYRPVYILGEVEQPGEYEYSERMSVYALVAKAGGFTYRADESVVFVRHGDEAEEKAYRLTSGAAVMPGDTVRIVERYF